MEGEATAKSSLGRIALVSAAGLLLEMVLVRWVAAEVRVFAYMHNLVLIAAFLGIGLGCHRAGQKHAWTRGLLALVALVLLVTDPLRFDICEKVASGIGASEDAISWIWSFEREKAGGGLAIFAVAFTVFGFALIVLACEPFGQELGALMGAHPRPVAAYSANLAGSLAGTWGFFALSAASTGPIIWFAVAGALTIWVLHLSGRSKREVAFAAALLAAPSALVAIDEFRYARYGFEIVWSPYQKLDVQPVKLPSKAGVENEGEAYGHRIRINKTIFQACMNLSREFRATRPDIYGGKEINHYDLPYRVIPPVGKILCVGAGSGNDAAAAVRNGAQHVDAVEIDPVIMKLGKKLHPEQPYTSPKVNPVADDARAFLKRAEPGTYDVVWFGLLDSHTTGSGYTNIRLDHYVYTRESFAEAKRLLKPGGVIVCAFESSQMAWVGNRVHGLLTTTFDGVKPLGLKMPVIPHVSWGGEVFFAGPADVVERVRQSFAAQPELQAYLAKSQSFHENDVRLTTDDWPYLYLREPKIPAPYMLVAGAILASAVVAGIVAKARGALARPDSMSMAFFFLGAAFLLLEVVGVSRAALLFGTTWVVTAVVVSGVLTMALLANLWVANSKSESIALPFAGIVATGVALLVVPLDVFASLPRIAVGPAAGAFLAAPLFFSGILFTRLYRQAPRRDLALAWNLFGAILGGFLEAASFIFGFHALTGLAIAFYGLAFFAARAARSGAAPPAA